MSPSASCTGKESGPRGEATGEQIGGQTRSMDDKLQEFQASQTEAKPQLAFSGKLPEDEEQEQELLKSSTKEGAPRGSKVSLKGEKDAINMVQGGRSKWKMKESGEQQAARGPSKQQEPSSKRRPQGKQVDELAASLRKAANEGKVELVRLLLRCGANANQQDAEVSRRIFTLFTWTFCGFFVDFS